MKSSGPLAAAAAALVLAGCGSATKHAVSTGTPLDAVKRGEAAGKAVVETFEQEVFPSKRIYRERVQKMREELPFASWTAAERVTRAYLPKIERIQRKGKY